MLVIDIIAMSKKKWENRFVRRQIEILSCQIEIQTALVKIPITNGELDLAMNMVDNIMN